MGGCTAGSLCVDGVFFCNTLEDKDRNVEDVPDAKVAGETAIPRGEYSVFVTWSPHLRRNLPLLRYVAGFNPTWISNEAAACGTYILVGTKSEDAWVGLSRRTFAILMGMIEETLYRGEDVKVKIT